MGPCLASNGRSSLLSLVPYPEQDKPKYPLKMFVPWVITSPATVGCYVLDRFRISVRMIRGNLPYSPLVKDTDHPDLEDNRCAQLEYS
jgi:hypothetical protein